MVDIAGLRKERDLGKDMLVSFGVLPGVLAEVEMTVNIIPSKNPFCLCDITRTD